MLEFIKKNKNIILSSSIFSGINSNIYCGGCKKISGKGDENNKKKETTETTETTKTPENNNLKDKKDTLKKLLKKINEENNKLKDECKEKITIDDNFIDSKTKDDELTEIENNLNTILTNINNKLKDKANLKEESETPENPPKDKKPPVDEEFEKEKTELIEKVNNLEKDFKKFIFDEKTFIKTLKDKLKVITKENIGQIKKSFETKDKELKKIINFDKFLTDNNYGEFLISSDINLDYDFSFYDLENKEIYRKKTEEIKDKISKLGIAKDNIRNYRIVNFNYDNVKCYFIVKFDINKKNVLLDYFKDNYNYVLEYNTDYFIFDEKDELKLFILNPCYINQCFNITDRVMVGDKLSKEDHSFFRIFFNDSFEVLNKGNDPFADFFIDKIDNNETKETYYCLRFGKKTFDIIKKEGGKQRFIKCINDNLYYIIYNQTAGKFIDTELKIKNCSKYYNGSGITSGEYWFTI